MNLTPPRSYARFTVPLLVALVAGALVSAQRATSPPADPLAAEISRWSQFVASDTASDDNSTQVRKITGPVLDQARTSLESGRRLHALFRLGAARAMLAALAYTREHPEAARSLEALEAEWKRIGPELRAASAPRVTKSLADVYPAAVRAMAEAAVPAIEISYDASLVYGKATIADAGLYYVGEAVAHQQFVALCRSLRENPAGREPAFRSLRPELDALQAEMLAVYRPPVSIERHGEFIGASAALKEARALDALGLTRGGMLRYLQATLRFQPLRANPPVFDSGGTPARLADFARRLDEHGVDHSLGLLFLQVAHADLADTSATATHAPAAAVAEVVLPRYFDALEPAAKKPAAPAPRAVVTLVRWPYT